MAKSLTIEEAELRHPDMVKGQKWCGAEVKYDFYCKKHGIYSQLYEGHNAGRRCSKCGFIRTGKLKALGIKKAELKNPDMVKGQMWRTTKTKYKFICEKHGVYRQQYDNHSMGKKCKQCVNETANGLSHTPEYRTVVNHFRNIFHLNSTASKNYWGMTFYDGWNPNKGGSFLSGAKWVVENLGKRPNKNASLHIVEHEKGFVPNNLEWASKHKQNAQQMFKIIANLKHRIKELELKLEERGLL